MDKDKIYWVGGSPCSGKSTMAEMLVKEYDFDYYKCDDHLDRYIDIGVKENNPLMKEIKSKSLDEIWLRPPNIQSKEEFEFYRYALKIIEKDVNEMYCGKNIVAEGAAILPEYVQAKKIPKDRYICIVPTEEFQLEKYSKRGWVKHYLKGCTNPTKAFDNWMKRDAIYAKEVINQAKKHSMNYIVVDGRISIDEQYKIVKRKFRL